MIIEAVGGKGDGIAKVEGFVLFVPGTRQGEQVKVRITKVLRNVGFAEVVSRGGADRPAKKEELPEEEPEDEPDEPSYEDTETFGEE